jgi:hypothetical protein
VRFSKALRNSKRRFSLCITSPGSWQQTHLREISNSIGLSVECSGLDAKPKWNGAPTEVMESPPSSKRGSNCTRAPFLNAAGTTGPTEADTLIAANHRWRDLGQPQSFFMSVKPSSYRDGYGLAGAWSRREQGVHLSASAYGRSIRKISSRLSPDGSTGRRTCRIPCRSSSAKRGSPSRCGSI